MFFIKLIIGLTVLFSPLLLLWFMRRRLTKKIRKNIFMGNNSIYGKIYIGRYAFPIAASISVIFAVTPWGAFNGVFMNMLVSIAMHVFPNINKALAISQNSMMFSNYFAVANFFGICAAFFAVIAGARHFKLVSPIGFSGKPMLLFYLLSYLVVFFISAYMAMIFFKETIWFVIPIEQGVSKFIFTHVISWWVLSLAVFVITLIFCELTSSDRTK